MSGDASGAVDLLADVLGVSTAPPVASTTSLSLSSSVAIFGTPVTARVVGDGRHADGVGPGARRRHVGGHRRRSPRTAPRRSASPRTSPPAGTRSPRSTGEPRPPTRRSSGSTSAAVTLTVTKTLPTVRTDGTDWTVRRTDPKDVHVQVTGVAGVTPTGTVDVWVNGVAQGARRRSTRAARRS